LKLLKWLAGLFLTLVLLLLVAVIAIPMMVDPNDYRDELTSLVKDKTGRDLGLEGELKISVFPWLGIDVAGLSLSQPEQIGGDMLSVENAQLRVKLMPLFSKQVEVDTVVLKQPSVRLVTLKDGTDSFSGLTGDSETEETTTPEQEAGAAIALVIQGVELTDGSVVIEDRSADSRTEIKDLNLVTGNLIGDSLAKISLSGRLIDAEAPSETVFSLDGQAQINTDTLQVSVADVVASVTQGELDAELKINSIDVNEAQAIQVKGVNVTVAGTIEENQLGAALNVSTIDVSSTQEIQVKDVTVNVTSPQKATVSVPGLSVKMESQEARASLIKVTSGNLQATVSDLVATQFIDAPNARGKLSVPAFNAASMLKDFEVDFEPSEKTALTSVGLDAVFNAGLESASVSDLVLSLDKSKLTGSASVKNYEAPSIKFDIVLDSLNLDSYLPASEEGAEEEEAAVTGGEALVVPMAVFKDINANGSFKATSLISGGVELSDIDVQVVSTPGNVTITPKANLYNGKVDGQIAYSEVDGTSKLKIKNEIDLVELGEMLTATDITDQLTGIGSLIVDVVVTEKDGVQSNEGTIKLLAKDGAIQGVDIKGMVESAYTQYKSYKGSEPEAETEETQSEANDETRFAELLGTFYLKDSKITNDDFAMKAPLFRIGGKGDIDIEKELIDYVVDFSVVNSTDGQGGDALEKLKGITIPIRLKGDMTAPSYSLDLKAMYKSLAKQRIDEEKDKYIKEKLGLEGEEKLSTKDALKQYLLNKATKDDESSEGEERPIGERAVGEVEGEAEQSAEPEKSDKDKLKDDLKKKLLDGLFN